MAKVSIVMGSESDRDVAVKAADVLSDFGVEHEMVIRSAHRDPDGLKKYVDSSDASIFIAVAGLSAALPGAIASHTVRPVVGVPKEAKLGGLDSLLSIAQMPPGIPVACVGIDNSRNAALLAIEILALNDKELEEKLDNYRENRRART